jgi:predicted DCC family thiol-disulfide oxidoreductase YuxK
MTGEADAEPGVTSDGAVVLFDGVCTLCNGLVSFLIPRDSDGRFQFAALQSDAGQELLTRHGLPTEGFDSFVLVEGEQVYTKSAAAIRVAELLGWPYRAARVGRLIPRGLRDSLYDVVADNRYDWFGRKDRCMIPDEDVSDRLL